MKSKLKLAAFALAPLLMAQTPPPATVNDAGSPVLEPQAIEFSTEPQTATGTTAMLTQHANALGVVRVDAPVAGSIPVGNASISLSLTPGTELFLVLLQQRREVRLFCTTQVQTTTYSPIRPPLITRTCLADTNSDRIFDHLAYIQLNVTLTRAVSGSWEVPLTPHISSGAVTIATNPNPSPVPYMTLQAHRIAPVQLELTAR